MVVIEFYILRKKTYDFLAKNLFKIILLNSRRNKAKSQSYFSYFQKIFTLEKR